MLCQVKIIDIHVQPKWEKKKYIQSDLPSGLILHFYYPENEIHRLIRVTVPHIEANGSFARQWLFHNENFNAVKTIILKTHWCGMNDGIKLKATILIDWHLNDCELKFVQCSINVKKEGHDIEERRHISFFEGRIMYIFLWSLLLDSKTWPWGYFSFLSVQRKQRRCYSWSASLFRLCKLLIFLCGSSI